MRTEPRGNFGHVLVPWLAVATFAGSVESLWQTATSWSTFLYPGHIGALKLLEEIGGRLGFEALKVPAESLFIPTAGAACGSP